MSIDKVQFFMAIRRFQTAMTDKDIPAIAKASDTLRFDFGQRQADLIAMCKDVGIDRFVFEDRMEEVDNAQSWL